MFISFVLRSLGLTYTKGFFMTTLLSKYHALPIGFGGASISGEGAGYGFGDISEDNAISLLNHAFDRGLRVFDTAPIYGFGESERRIGKAFNKKRDQVFIVSKSGVTWDQNKRVDMSNDPKVTQKMLEQSLRDLNTEYIDLYMIHWPDQRVDIRRPMEVLAEAKHQGKIKHIGLCNSNKEDFEAASSIEKIEVFQSQFNYFEKGEVENTFPICREKNVSFMSWGTLDKGIITGRVTKERKFDASDCRSWAPWWKSIDKDSRYQEMARIKEKLNEYGFNTIQFALSFNLSFSEITMLLCGTRNHEQLDSLIESYNKRIPTEVLQKIIAK